MRCTVTDNVVLGEEMGGATTVIVTDSVVLDEKMGGATTDSVVFD